MPTEPRLKPFSQPIILHGAKMRIVWEKEGEWTPFVTCCPGGYATDILGYCCGKPDACEERVSR